MLSQLALFAVTKLRISRDVVTLSLLIMPRKWMGLTCELHVFRVYQPLLRVPESIPTGNKARF